MQELTSMNVQMRLITADNIEQLTKQGDRIIHENQIFTNSTSPKEEDLLARIKRENEEQLRLNENVNGNYGESELLTREEKKQLLNMNPQKIREFIEGHNVLDLTPLQKELFVKIISESQHYMRLEQELSDNELYKTVLKDEIDKMFEPTNSEKALYKELYGEVNLNNNKVGTTFGGSRQNVKNSDKMIVSKIGNESNKSNKSNESNELNKSNESTSNESTSNESTSNESTSNKSTSNESTSNKSTSNESTSNESTESKSNESNESKSSDSETKVVKI